MATLPTYIRAFEIHAGARADKWRRFNNALTIRGGETLEGLAGNLRALFNDQDGRVDKYIQEAIEEQNLRRGVFGWSGKDLTTIQNQVMVWLTAPPGPDNRGESGEASGAPGRWWAHESTMDAARFIKQTRNGLVDGSLRGDWLMWSFVPNANGEGVSAKVWGGGQGSILEPETPDRDYNDVKMRIPFYVADFAQQGESFKCLASTVLNFIAARQLDNPGTTPTFSFKMVIGEGARGQCGKEIDFMCSNLDSLGEFVKFVKRMMPCALEPPRCDMALPRHLFGAPGAGADQQTEHLETFAKNMRRNKFEFLLVRLKNNQWITFRNERLSAITFELMPGYLDDVLGLEGTIDLFKKSKNMGMLYQAMIDAVNARLAQHESVGYVDTPKDYADSLVAPISKALAALQKHPILFSTPVIEEVLAMHKLL